jgi:hypothetical protein
MVDKKQEVKKEAKPVEKKEPRVAKKICELSGGVGWVSFTPKQLEKIGLDPAVNTTSDLRKVVFDALELSE